MEETSVKRFSILAITAILAVAACTGGSPTGAAGPVDITFLVGIAEDPEVDQQAQAQIEEFNASHPNINVKREALDNDQLRTIIQTRLGSGDVDIFGYDTGPGFGGVLAKAGLVADMEPAYDKYGWKTFDWAKARCTYSGVLSCLPGAVEEVGIFYNKTMFDAKGFKEPQTLDEFRTIMDAFKADEIVPLAFGDQPQWPAGHQYSMTLSNIVGREGMDARLYGDKKWNDAAGVQALDIYFQQF